MAWRREQSVDVQLPVNAGSSVRVTVITAACALPANRKTRATTNAANFPCANIWTWSSTSGPTGPDHTSRTYARSAMSFDTTGLVAYVNGEYKPVSEASVSIFDHGFLYGDGVFEGMRVFDGGLFRAA